jgi:hypothetical protein
VTSPDLSVRPLVGPLPQAIVGKENRLEYVSLE